MRAGAAASVAALALLLGACRSPAERSASTTTSTVSVAVAAAYGRPTLLARIESSDIDENSGLAASRRVPGLVWAHNDSGDVPLLYCVDRAGRSCGVWSVTAAKARDWEDMAAGPGPVAGERYLYMGDIGDNRGDQPAVTIYRVPEPVANPGDGSSKARPRRTAPAEAIRLRYEDGPHDAEALFVHPATGDVYVVAKGIGAAAVYKAGGGVLRRVGTVALGAGEWVTGGDISPDGRRVALCTYFGGYELTLPAGSDSVFDDVWGALAVPVDLGDRAQGESVAYGLDGRSLVASSEGSPAPLYEVKRR
ncbi:MAG: hypothetical protein ACRD0Q_12060 [Acidimicrobiales bacterium]